MGKNKDWWDFSWNPPWGCENDCEFCYARRMAKRLWKRIYEKEFKYHVKHNPGCAWTGDHLSGLKDFKPTWLESNYNREFPKKPSIIFVNSMSDPYSWEKEWYERITQRIAKSMQHTFVILTKYPEVYQVLTFPHNTILGVSMTKNSFFAEHREAMEAMEELPNKRLLSIEPIQENFFRRKENGEVSKVDLYFLNRHLALDWIHVGIETGNRRGKYIPLVEEILPFYDLEVRVFMKESLREILGDRELRQEWPELTA